MLPHGGLYLILFGNNFFSSTLQLLIYHYYYFFLKNMQTSLTAAGCYISPAPGSKGTRCIISSSVDCPLPSAIEVFHAPSYREEKHDISDGLEQIINDGKSYLEHFIPKASDVHFLDSSPESVLDEAKRLNIISESTYRIIISLQMQETKLFKADSKFTPGYESKHGSHSVKTLSSGLLKSGQMCNFMNRFSITWKIRDENEDNSIFEAASCNTVCKACVLGCDMELEVRHMTESDWLYLSKLSECTVDDFQDQRDTSSSLELQTMESPNGCLNYATSSARRALVLLKLIPVAARRSLPVLVNHQGLLLSIPVRIHFTISRETANCIFKGIGKDPLQFLTCGLLGQFRRPYSY